jgi:hypothetical protein
MSAFKRWGAEGLMVSQGEIEIARIQKDPNIEDWKEQRADANQKAALIAAAPDMYEALKFARDVLGHMVPKYGTQTLARLDTAIAKAEGRAG